MPCTQRDLRVRLNDLLRDKVEAPMLGDSCQQQYAFHPCEPLADTHARTATEWEVCEFGTFLFGFRRKTFRVETFRARENNADCDASHKGSSGKWRPSALHSCRYGCRSSPCARSPKPGGYRRSDSASTISVYLSLGRSL